MKIISIAFKDLKINLRDKKTLALIILMPILLIMVLGACLSSIFNQSDVKINKFDIAFVDLDKGQYSKELKNFLTSGEIKDMIAIKEINEDKAMDMVRSGDIPAAIVVPSGYSNLADKGEKANLNIYLDPGDQLRGNIVESIIKSYLSFGSSIAGAAKSSVEVLSQYGVDGTSVIPEIMKAARSDDGLTASFKENDVEKKQGLSAMQYYSAAMLVMYMLFVGMIGTTSIIEERDKKTLMRIMSTSTSNGSIITGKMLGLFLLGVVDAASLMVFTRFVFNVSWGKSVTGILLLSLSMIFAVSGFSMLIATLFKSSKSLDSASSAIVMVVSFLGGSMYPLMSMPSVLQNLSKITPNGWALRGYINLMLGGSINSIMTPVMVLCAMGIVFLTAGIVRLKLS